TSTPLPYTTLFRSVFHADVQRLHVKMPLPRIDLLKDRIALRRLTQGLVLQVSREDLLYLFIDGGIRKYLILCHDELTRKDNNPFCRYKVARLFRQSGRKDGLFRRPCGIIPSLQP